MVGDKEQLEQLPAGLLHKELYVTITEPLRSPEIAEGLHDHLQSQIEMERAGVMSLVRFRPKISQGRQKRYVFQPTVGTANAPRFSTAVHKAAISAHILVPSGSTMVTNPVFQGVVR